VSASVAVIALVGVSGLLIVSAAAKAARPAIAGRALIELGMPGDFARVLVSLAVAAEQASAGALVLWPQARLAQGLCLALFATFALIGALALRSGRVIECGCYGSLHRSTLGWTQIVQLPVVAACLITIDRFLPTWDLRTGAALLWLLQVVAAVLLLARLAPVWWRIRRDRNSLGSVKRYVQKAGWPEFLEPVTGGSPQ
jgi:hypothetical protein